MFICLNLCALLCLCCVLNITCIFGVWGNAISILSVISCTNCIKFTLTLTKKTAFWRRLSGNQVTYFHIVHGGQESQLSRPLDIPLYRHIMNTCLCDSVVRILESGHWKLRYNTFKNVNIQYCHQYCGETLTQPWEHKISDSYEKTNGDSTTMWESKRSTKKKKKRKKTQSVLEYLYGKS